MLTNQEALNLLENKIIVEGDTISIKELIFLSRGQQIELEITKVNYDTLLNDYESSLSIISELKTNSLNAAKKDSLQSENISLYKTINEQWESKYNKLIKKQRIGGLIAIQTITTYSEKTKELNVIPLSLELGITFNRKWSFSLLGGLGLKETYLVGGRVAFNL